MIRFGCFLLLMLSASAVKYPPQPQAQQQRRLQNNDKNNDKNNKNSPTILPSSVPSVVPTDSPRPSPSPSGSPTRSPRPTIARPTNPTRSPTPPPTPQPTPLPTPLPTPQPTRTPSMQPTRHPTTPPTPAPTTEFPTLQGTFGFVQFEFVSLDPVPQVQVQNALSAHICQQEFVLLEGVCYNESTGILDSTVLRAPLILVEERSNVQTEFTSWQVLYPVINMSNKFIVEAIDLQQNPEELLNDKLHETWNITELSRTLQTPIGLQGDTFMVKEEDEEPTEAPIDDDEQFYWQPLQPEVWSPMRIVGISMLICTSLLWYWIVHLARQRRIEREWDAEFQERGKGGLVTEEGLDFMLAAGRQSSHAPPPATPSTDPAAPEDEEEERRLPLPGYMTTTAYNTHHPPNQEEDEMSYHTTSSASHVTM